jgi:F-type H+-transporting ATPase subunit a
MQAVTPQVVFYLFGLPFLPITNTVVSTWVLMVIIIFLAIIIRKIKPIAGEMLIEFVNNIVSSVMPEGTEVAKFLILLGPLAVFLVFANIFSILPRMVSPTADINTTIALSIIIFFAVHIFGILEKGVKDYFIDLVNPIYIFPLEIVSQFSRTVSLSIRLFGNILSTDLIVAIVFTLIPFIIPLPFAALGILTGVLQAYIFLVLASLYISSGIEIQEMEEERRKLKEEASKLS